MSDETNRHSCPRARASSRPERAHAGVTGWRRLRWRCARRRGSGCRERRRRHEPGSASSAVRHARYAGTTGLCATGERADTAGLYASGERTDATRVHAAGHYLDTRLHSARVPGARPRIYPAGQRGPASGRATGHRAGQSSRGSPATKLRFRRSQCGGSYVRRACRAPPQAARQRRARATAKGRLSAPSTPSRSARAHSRALRRRRRRRSDAFPRRGPL